MSLKLEITIKNKSIEQVTCPRVNEKVDTKVCSHCQFLAIIDYPYIKCGWTEKKEGLARGDLFYDTY